MDVVEAVAMFFLNPLFVVALLAAVALGYFRVKRERRDFKVRLLPGLTELKRLLAESWFFAMLISVLIVGAGLVVDPGGSFCFRYCRLSLCFHSTIKRLRQFILQPSLFLDSIS